MLTRSAGTNDVRYSTWAQMLWNTRRNLITEIPNPPISSAPPPVPFSTLDTPTLFVQTLNDAGTFAGVWEYSNGLGRAFTGKGKATTFLNLPLGSSIQAINNTGWLAGNADAPTSGAFYCVLQQGKWSAPRYLSRPGGVNGFARALNNHGDIVGGCTPPELRAVYGTQACLWTKNRCVLLKPLDRENGRPLPMSAQDINNQRQVVGYGEMSGPSPVPNAPVHKHAFLYENGRMTDLNSRISAGSGWVLEEAVAINDKGAIAGNGTFRGRQCGFLLTKK